MKSDVLLIEISIQQKEHCSTSFTINVITLWLFNIAMENGPFIDEFPIKTSICKGFSMAMLNNRMVYVIHH
jgi:hypothetical protein